MKTDKPHSGAVKVKKIYLNARRNIKVGLKSIDAAMLQKMFLSGAKALDAKKEYINGYRH